ncbi:MAG: zf-HC2 domain-containing protein [Candidatus Aminicenantes bacterium]|nr:zf-HC2 domain-containing protein [Candidatus Aminicenantes bacterium]
MKMCKCEYLIDDYLFNRLDDEKKKKFEEHYFNCPYCFEKMVERDELISLIKQKGDGIFQDEYVVEERKGATWFEKIVSFFTPKQWALIPVYTALLLIVVFILIPYFKPAPPQFFISEDRVRGESITLISPVIDIKTVPSKFEWKDSGEDVEYKIYIYDDGEKLWTTTTKDNFIVLPEKVRKRMTLGEKYSWEVKAFSPKGTLIALSSKVHFKITKGE